MKIAIRSYGAVGNTLNGYGGGEGRWTSNMAYFLQSEGHEVVRCAEGQDHNCDLFLDASWERCQYVNAPVHVHHSFFACNNGALEFPCLPSGDCNLAVPHRREWVQDQNWKKLLEKPFNNIFLPVPYPDNLLPSNVDDVRGFDRTEILWATKDMFHPNFEPQTRPDGREQVFIQGGLDTLKALLRLQKKTEFTMHFLLKEMIDQAHPRFGVPQLLSQFRNKQFYGRVLWTDLISIAARCKLNVPVGGLWGSIPESIFTKGLPMFFSRNCWSNEFGTLLPFPENADEQDIYEALETLWFDERVYQRNFEIQQMLFEDHRTEGLRRNFKIAFEQLGL